MRGLLTAVAVAIVLVVAGLFLMGMPGHLVFIAGDWPFGRYLEGIRGDRLLEVSVWMSLLWPPVIPVAYLLARSLSRPSAAAPAATGSNDDWRRSRALAAAAVFVAVLFAWAVLLASMLHHLASGVAQP